MKTATIAGIATILATAGTAAAGEPMELTDAQLDYVTAGNTGGRIFNDSGIVVIVTPGSDGVTMTLGDGSVRLEWESRNDLVLVSPSTGKASTRPAEFVVITVGQKTLELPPDQR